MLQLSVGAKTLLACFLATGSFVSWDIGNSCLVQCPFLPGYRWLPPPSDFDLETAWPQHLQQTARAKLGAFSAIPPGNVATGPQGDAHFKQKGNRGPLKFSTSPAARCSASAWPEQRAQGAVHSKRCHGRGNVEGCQFLAGAGGGRALKGDAARSASSNVVHARGKSQSLRCISPFARLPSPRSKRRLFCLGLIICRGTTAEKRGGGIRIKVLMHPKPILSLQNVYGNFWLGKNLPNLQATTPNWLKGSRTTPKLTESRKETSAEIQITTYPKQTTKNDLYTQQKQHKQTKHVKTKTKNVEPPSLFFAAPK